MVPSLYGEHMRTWPPVFRGNANYEIIASWVEAWSIDGWHATIYASDIIHVGVCVGVHTDHWTDRSIVHHANQVLCFNLSYFVWALTDCTYILQAALHADYGLIDHIFTPVFEVLDCQAWPLVGKRHGHHLIKIPV